MKKVLLTIYSICILVGFFSSCNKEDFDNSLPNNYSEAIKSGSEYADKTEHQSYVYNGKVYDISFINLEAEPVFTDAVSEKKTVKSCLSYLKMIMTSLSFSYQIGHIPISFIHQKSDTSLYKMNILF